MDGICIKQLNDEIHPWRSENKGMDKIISLIVYFPPSMAENTWVVGQKNST
jgi:hypothetical protein